jgi:hypothetical protein
LIGICKEGGATQRSTSVKTKPRFPINNSRSRKHCNSKNSSNVKAWVGKAIAEESKNPSDQMWKKEPSAEIISDEQAKRIRFLRKHGKTDPTLNLIADCLDQCEKGDRCFSGACLECGRLFQRFYVRHSKRSIRDIVAREGNELVGICIIPSSPLVRPGQIKHFSIYNFHRRIKSALDFAGIKSGMGGVDFSFNEDRDQDWQPFICPHVYLITSTNDREKLRQSLKKIFRKTLEVNRPIKLPLFHNNAYRRSYSLKMIFKRRISYYKLRKENPTKSRNTSTDKLRVDQRIELYKYLHQIGLAARIIVRGLKPEASRSKVRFRKA